MYRKVKIYRSLEEETDYVAEDIKFKLFINGKIENSFRISPLFLKEFSIGYCFGEGIIGGLEDVLRIKIDNNSARLEVKKKERKFEKIKSNFQIESREIVFRAKDLIRKAKAWKKTGGTHVSMLISGDTSIIVEDVSRHACIDKLLGISLERGINFEESYVVCSGRLCEGRVRKIVMAGIPILASIGAPLLSGVLFARKYGVTLIGFAKRENFNIYANSERIKF